MNGVLRHCKHSWYFCIALVPVSLVFYPKLILGLVKANIQSINTIIKWKSCVLLALWRHKLHRDISSSFHLSFSISNALYINKIEKCNQSGTFFSKPNNTDKKVLYKFLDNYFSSNAMSLVFWIRIQASNDKPRKTCFGCISKPKSKFKNRKTLRSCLRDRSADMTNRFG